MAVEIHIVFPQKTFLIISIIYKKQKSWGKIKIKDKMIGPGQPDKTYGPPGPVGFTKQPARPERIFCWARPGRAARFEPCCGAPIQFTNNELWHKFQKIVWLKYINSWRNISFHSHSFISLLRYSTETIEWKKKKFVWDYSKVIKHYFNIIWLYSIKSIN